VEVGAAGDLIQAQRLAGVDDGEEHLQTALEGAHGRHPYRRMIHYVK
jgi:hypothetical protein